MKYHHHTRARLLLSAFLGMILGFATVMLLFGHGSAQAAPKIEKMASSSAYRQFVDDFWPRAKRAGISRSTYRRAFRVMQPDWEVIRRQRHQPEFKLTPAEYLRTRVSEKRIMTGVEKLRRHKTLLRNLQARFGVDRHILLAIWGLESNYGSHKGKHDVIRALATLSMAGRRKRYGRQQLLAALKILQSGDISPAQMRGSWAGAMGHTQFIPTTYLGYAVDVDGDRRRDIWNSVPDALASTANYLKKRGWRRGLPWGWRVHVPARARHLLGRRHARSIAAWEKLGVRPATAKAFYGRKARAWLVKLRGDANLYLVTRNFRAILAYNNARTYALAVGTLADAIARAASGTRPVATAARGNGGDGGGSMVPRPRPAPEALRQMAREATAGGIKHSERARLRALLEDAVNATATLR